MGFTTEHQNTPYDRYNVTQTYIWDAGILQLPRAGQNQAPTGVGGQGPDGAANQRVLSLVIAAAAPSGMLVVQFVAEKKNGIPRLPHPDPGLTGFYLAKAELTLEPPQEEADGQTRVYRVRGVYTYVMSQPVWVTDGITFGNTPYDDGFVSSGSQVSIPTLGPGSFDKTLWGEPVNKLGL